MLEKIVERKAGTWNEIESKTTSINNLIYALSRIEDLPEVRETKRSAGAAPDIAQANYIFWKTFINIAYQDKGFAMNFAPTKPLPKQWLRFHWENEYNHYLNVGYYTDHIEIDYRYPAEQTGFYEMTRRSMKEDRYRHRLDDYGRAIRVTIPLPEDSSEAETDEILAGMMVQFKNLVQAYMGI